MDVHCLAPLPWPAPPLVCWCWIMTEKGKMLKCAQSRLNELSETVTESCFVYFFKHTRWLYVLMMMTLLHAKCDNVHRSCFRVSFNCYVDTAANRTHRHIWSVRISGHCNCRVIQTPAGRSGEHWQNFRGPQLSLQALSAEFMLCRDHRDSSIN